MNLSYKLSSLVATYSEGKPTLIFCSSRKATQFTAATVARDSRLQLAWAQRQSLQVKTKIMFRWNFSTMGHLHLSAGSGKELQRSEACRLPCCWSWLSPCRIGTGRPTRCGGTLSVWEPSHPGFHLNPGNGSQPACSPSHHQGNWPDNLEHLQGVQRVTGLIGHNHLDYERRFCSTLHLCFPGPPDDWEGGSPAV